MGVKVTTVFAGSHKNDLSPNEPLTDQSLQVLNEIVQESYQLFTTHVAEYRNRDVADIIATEAGCYRGAAAIAVGLADRMETPQFAVDNLSRAVALSRGQRQGGVQARQRISVQASAFAIQSKL
jgi:ClpP class serine protease